jgi:DNA-binding transcriptional LysR family regulator
MIQSLNLDAIQSFAVFADKLNFTHAAEELHISQPALHMKINGLSVSLGVPLYRRIGRRLELTEQGEIVARFGRQLNDSTDDLKRELLGTGELRPVVLAAGEGAFLYILGPAIREFLRKEIAPLRLLTLDRDGVLNALRSGKAHVGVAALDSVPADLSARLLCKVEQVVAMPHDHPFARKRRLTLRDLEGSRLVVPPIDRPHRQMLSAALQSAGVSWEVAVEATGWELMLQFVRLGMGIAVVNSVCSIPRGLQTRTLTELPKIHYYVVQLRTGAKSETQQELSQLLLKHGQQ